MAYVWTTGETITAAKLNATGGGVLQVTESDATHTLDKTWQEINDAGFSILNASMGQALQMSCIEDEGDYLVSYWTYGLAEPALYIASSPSDYPVLDI